MFVQLLICVGVLALAYVASRWLYQKDTEIEDRRRSALKMSAALNAQGLTKVGAFFEDYAVGDYSGMLKKLKDAAVVLSHDAGLQAEFEGVFDKLLADKLTDPVAAAAIAAQATAAAGTPAAPAVATSATPLFTADHIAGIVANIVAAAKPVATEVARDAAAVAAVVA